MAIANQKQFDEISEYLAEEFALEVSKSRQNHVATGKLINSIEGKTVNKGDSLEIHIYMQDYYKYVNEGRRANLKGPPIMALAKWVKDKSLSLNDVKGKNRAAKIMNLAFMIQRSIKKNGIPAPGSNKFSKTGKRVNFIEETLKRIEGKLNAMIENALFGEFEIKMNKILDNVIKL